jgi:hypothetical protein
VEIVLSCLGVGVILMAAEERFPGRKNSEQHKRIMGMIDVAFINSLRNLDRTLWNAVDKFTDTLDNAAQKFERAGRYQDLFARAKKCYHNMEKKFGSQC